MAISQAYLREILDAANAYRTAYNSLRLEIQTDAAEPRGTARYVTGMSASIYLNHYPVDHRHDTTLAVAEERYKRTVAANIRQRRYLARKKLSSDSLAAVADAKFLIDNAE